MPRFRSIDNSESGFVLKFTNAASIGDARYMSVARTGPLLDYPPLGVVKDTRDFLLGKKSLPHSIYHTQDQVIKLFGENGRITDGRQGELLPFGSPTGSTVTGYFPVRRDDNLSFAVMDGKYQQRVINAVANRISEHLSESAAIANYSPDDRQHVFSGNGYLFPMSRYRRLSNYTLLFMSG